ncbi:hypothetical protein B484DRAFT_440760, partial [Ochromonadaceae sp. CCMP2298]
MLEFEYYIAQTVVSASPTTGSASGGALVTLAGSNFRNSSSLSCRFGSSLVPATYLSPSAVQCAAPRTPHGAVEVEVSNNGLEFSSSSGVVFRYVVPLLVQSVLPGRGPGSGGTLVRILLHTAGGVKACRFQGTAVPALLEGNAVLCVTPAGVGVALVELLDASNATVGTAEFAFTPQPTTLSLSPPALSEAGGSVLVNGAGFANYHTMLCRFGPHVGVASYISPSLLRCTAPAQSPGLKKLALSLNGVDFSNTNLSLSFFGRPTLLRIAPSVVSARGGAVVRFLGTNVHTQGLQCRFEWVESSASLVVNASALACRAPRHLPGRVTVTLAYNGEDVSQTANTIMYVAEPAVDSISPLFGHLLGETVVHLYGAD